MTALLIMRCARPCPKDFLHESWSKICRCRFMPSHVNTNTHAFPSLAKASPSGSASEVQTWSGFRGCLKTEERMRKSTLRLQPRKTCLVRRFQTESCSHAVGLERYETMPAVPSLLLQSLLLSGRQIAVEIISPSG